MARFEEKPKSQPDSPNGLSAQKRSTPKGSLRSGKLPSDFSAYIAGLFETPLLSPEQEIMVAGRLDGARVDLARALFEDPFVCRIALTKLRAYLSNGRQKSPPIRIEDKTKQLEINAHLKRSMGLALGLCSRLEFAYAERIAGRSAVRGLPENDDSIDQMRRRLCSILSACDFETAFLEDLHKLYRLSVTKCQGLRRAMHKEEPAAVRRNATKLLRCTLIDHTKGYDELMQHSATLFQLQAELDRAVRDLFLPNRRLVIGFARKSLAAARDVGLDISELVHEGNIGLVRAAKKFDLRKGCKFSTYAVCWIRQHISRCITNRRKEHSHQGSWGALKESHAARARLSHELGRQPTDSEVAERLKISEGELFQLQLSHPVYLPMNGASAKSRGMIEHIPNSIGAPEISRPLDNRELATTIDELMRPLSDKHRQVLKLLYLLPQCQTLKEVGTLLKISRERVRQLEFEALTALRTRGTWKALEPFIDGLNPDPPPILSLLETHGLRFPKYPAAISRKPKRAP